MVSQALFKGCLNDVVREVPDYKDNGRESALGELLSGTAGGLDLDIDVASICMDDKVNALMVL